METLFSSLETYGDRPCLISADRVLSFAETMRTADDLYACDKVPHSGLAFVSAYNSVDAILAYIGAVRRGLAVHLLDPTKEEANRRLIDLYAPDVVVDTEASKPVEPRRPGTDIHPDICILLSTSGSTGAAKFVKLTHSNIRSNTKAIRSYLELTEADRGITSLKLFYSYGMSVVNIHLAAGASLVVTDLSTGDPGFWSLVAREDVTNIAGVPFTFELMLQAKTDLGRFPALRLLTQAGGKLSADLVRHFAEEGEKHGVAFCVMYGQTEASPRMSYLPPAFAKEAPGSIGQAVPGGKLYVVDEAHGLITEPGVSGELVYEGPNVMFGYAESRADLAEIEAIPALYTGDIAHFDARGLFYIDGRSSRFVKPFGLRVSLDEIERVLREEYTVVAATGTDERIVVAIEDEVQDGEAIVFFLAEKFGLPPATFVVAAGQPIPRLPSGKPDYRGLLGGHLAPTPRASLARYFFRELLGILTGKAQPPASVYDAYCFVLGGRIRNREITFRQAGGDSLTYMQLFLLLEEYLGRVPEDWAEMTITELEHVKGASFV
jgi:acyl-coenzyme A synthetase/AMP-(fatty) acid ligase